MLYPILLVKYPLHCTCRLYWKRETDVSKRSDFAVRCGVSLATVSAVRVSSIDVQYLRWVICVGIRDCV